MTMKVKMKTKITLDFFFVLIIGTITDDYILLVIFRPLSRIDQLRL